MFLPNGHHTKHMQESPPSSNVSPILEQVSLGNAYQEVGSVERLVGLTIESRGPKAKLHDVCDIETNDPHTPTMPAEVVGFKDGKLQLMPLSILHAISPGNRVWNRGHAFRIPVGPELKGRVLDGLGQPLDDRYPIGQSTHYHVHAHPPHPLKRQKIADPLQMGIKAIDGFLTMGLGQRFGLFAGSGVGKSSLMGMMARNTEADISVIALIGERGREVSEFMELCLGEEGMKRSVVVVATAEQPALLKIKAAMVATTIAEYFREQGNNVLLMMDSLTRVAMALREVGLAVGEPPATRGYPPSMFAFMPQILERAGMSAEGSITGIYSVLVEGDDMNEPVADTVRGLLDGHIVMTRELAQRNHYPAIDIPQSVSRLMNQLATPEHISAANVAREMMSLYKQNEDLINIGAYVAGNNPKLDMAVRLKPVIDTLLKQSMSDAIPREETLAMLKELRQHAGG